MKGQVKPPMAAAKEPTTPIRTGTWRFERPVFVSRLAPCSEACPLGEDISAIMALNGKGDFERAHSKILEENPFPGICGRICFHPCERVCNRGRLDEPVSIQDLEWSAFKEGQTRKPQPAAHRERGRKVAVLGGGLAGFACAYFLTLQGHGVTVLEQGESPEIFSLTEKNPSLERADLEGEVDRILSLGVRTAQYVADQAGGYEEVSKEYEAVYVSPKLDSDPPREARGLVTLRSGLAVLDERETAAAELPAKGSQSSRTAVRQIAAGKRAALLIDLHFRGAPPSQIKAFAVGRLGAISYEVFKLGVTGQIPRPLQGVVRFEDLNIAHFEKMPRLHPASPYGILDKAQKMASARRCFQCGTCTFCMRCYDYCPDVSIQMDGKTRERSIDYDHCKGCGICAEECPRGAISWIHE
ncbi:MAG: 4Fe-4S binding protein [Desulfobacterota bacterium]|jgi:2-oxoacid:acceptor oxidoreductase delta subunit (pyruvate/2-ketoisovalerate family)|nr:4Fe-4S binding protein [Thermodesulfobacteriota bacterium]